MNRKQKLEKLRELEIDNKLLSEEISRIMTQLMAVKHMKEQITRELETKKGKTDE